MLRQVLCHRMAQPWPDWRAPMISVILCITGSATLVANLNYFHCISTLIYYRRPQRRSWCPLVHEPKNPYVVSHIQWSKVGLGCDQGLTKPAPLQRCGEG
jgi:hypothetical protein